MTILVETQAEGWPSSLALTSCRVCGIGVFVPVDELLREDVIAWPVHRSCLKQLDDGSQTFTGPGVSIVDPQT